MTPKKSKRKVETLVIGWKKCKLSEDGIYSLVEDRILQTRAIIQWRSADGEDRPYEGTNEIVLFRSFVERGLAIPTSDFFRSLLHHWKVQLHHLTPNSILHLSIFTHLCEAFLGIQPHFFFQSRKGGNFPASWKGKGISFFFSADHSEYRVEKFLVLCWEPSALASRTGSKFG